MITYSAGSELEGSAEDPSNTPPSQSIISVCEMAPSVHVDITSLEIETPDFTDFEHISTRLDSWIEESGFVRTICGSDDRVAVPDTRIYPHSAICFLEITFWDGSQERNFIGTGFLYSSTVVYTAAHCIYDRKYGYARRIRVFPGRNGANSPFGRLTSSSYYVPPEWVRSPSPNYDYGAVVLPQPGFSHSKFFGMEARPASYLTGERVKTAGYPGDKAYGTQWLVDGQVATVTANRFFYMIDTWGGQSGSPVFTTNQYGFGNHFTLGIHCYGGCPNGSTRVISQMLERLPKRD